MLLPKDLLTDLEGGDRTKEHLKPTKSVDDYQKEAMERLTGIPLTITAMQTQLGQMQQAQPSSFFGGFGR